ncbi:hypothetical protein LTR91_015529 [Friedmanniomyces endolithicus]|uniref:Uncharacterized protein n=1 Tax=Friedmanniomyces endolithicus TaxID=329885 RepID=A0AAN6QM16_9PEZI|nr:hypothetical protein LTR94_008685 [Friedmanniomyces endolithicus]KAK0776825.1 hypothetical protein LTR59_014055 [Friedmanniomyces endolithicus]KAK0795521.1 hypothetical protein LTR38_008850 [Friedmanniomyces endolithicus]KAK0817689.1 hypothetical protein LTR75_003024 [Friedmanniomyces endolithicus]KAK0838238.1 hypothetical protein LTR03_012197 [Friedmanniomyces endolithicus]
MANLLSPGSSLQPRSSTETDRRHLLADSVAPSRAASFITNDGDRTPRAHSPAPSDCPTDAPSSFKIPGGHPHPRRDTIADPSPAPQPYRGFPSEAHYLAALHAWADQQRYVDPGKTTLYGFYGHQSLQDYASKPPMEIGIRRKWRERREAKKEREREGGKIAAATTGRRGTVG